MRAERDLTGYEGIARPAGRCRANSTHVRQSRPDSGLGSQVKVFKPFEVVPSSLESGPDYPPGGVRPFRQKSTCPTQLILGPHVVQIWSRNTLELRGVETLVLHRVERDFVRKPRGQSATPCGRPFLLLLYSRCRS